MNGIGWTRSALCVFCMDFLNVGDEFFGDEG